MPGYTYCGTPRAYTETRDEEGVIVGAVSCGDTRELAGPLDADWFPAGEALPARLPQEPQEAPAATMSTPAGQQAPFTPAASGQPPSTPPAPAAGTPATPAAMTPAAGQRAS